MSDIANTAKGLIGKLEGQYDCSDFTQYVYFLHGKVIPHNSGDQYSEGKKSDGYAGDIVCWQGHVGICDGAGNVSHKIRKDPISKVSQWDGRKVKGYVYF